MKKCKLWGLIFLLIFLLGCTQQAAPPVPLPAPPTEQDTTPVPVLEEETAAVPGQDAVVSAQENSSRTPDPAEKGTVPPETVVSPPTAAEAPREAPIPTPETPPKVSPAVSELPTDPVTPDAPTETPPEIVTVSVTIQVQCTAALPYQEQLGLSLPADGLLVPPMTFTITPGSTSVYEALCATGARLVGSSGYIQGINGLFEKDCTPSSGWMYRVNGTPPIMSCGSYLLQGGEEIIWYYVV